MIKTALIPIFLLTVFSGFSQCPINPFIQSNYETDAKILLLRDILNNPSDPDFDNPFINEVRLIPYLEKLSAIYENPNNHPIIDSLFNEFQIHANVFYSPTIAYYNRIEFVVEQAMPWLEDFKNTGISGVAALDGLMTDHGFFIDSFFDLPALGVTVIYIETNDFINVSALVDDFATISGLHNVQPDISMEDGFNYVGIPYELYTHEYVEACDIEIDGELVVFSLLGGDCPMGCAIKKSYNILVTEDCEVTVLSASDMDASKTVFFPNPASDKLYLKEVSSKVKSVRIFSVQGKLLHTLKDISSGIDVTTLETGIYLLQIFTANGAMDTMKFIKK